MPKTTLALVCPPRSPTQAFSHAAYNVERLSTKGGSLAQLVTLFDVSWLVSKDLEGADQDAATAPLVVV